MRARALACTQWPPAGRPASQPASRPLARQQVHAAGQACCSPACLLFECARQYGAVDVIYWLLFGRPLGWLVLSLALGRLPAWFARPIDRSIQARRSIFGVNSQHSRSRRAKCSPAQVMQIIKDEQSSESSYSISNNKWPRRALVAAARTCCSGRECVRELRAGGQIDGGNKKLLHRAAQSWRRAAALCALAAVGPTCRVWRAQGSS